MSEFDWKTALMLVSGTLNFMLLMWQFLGVKPLKDTMKAISEEIVKINLHLKEINGTIQSDHAISEKNEIRVDKLSDQINTQKRT